MPREPGSGGAGPGFPVFRFDGRRLAATGHHPVSEFPVHLTVNGTALATLIASPHDLEYLVAGFLRMQGMVGRADDIVMLGVCPESGAASVRIRGEVPERLRPILTSGCGGGVGFHLPESGEAGGREEPREPAGEHRFSPGAVFAMMDSLGRQAERYKSHGGIHSAAAGDGKRILLAAEDIGRHNTIDRIAGEALLKGIDLSGKILVSSGRISSEMAAKGAALRVDVIASRTAPTDMAIRIAGEAGITLLGYVRGGRFTVYTHPWRIALLSEGEGPLEGVTGVILAGGPSTRMGKNKALLPWRGGRLIEEVYGRMSRIFREVIVVTNSPDLYPFLPCRMVPDLYPGMGSLAGVHSGLKHAGTPWIFAVACDMPFLEERLVRRLLSLREGADVVIPVGPLGPEPLHAAYGDGALRAVEELLTAGERRVLSIHERVRARKVSCEEVGSLDPEGRSFRNINTPEDYSRLLGEETGSGPDALESGGDRGRQDR